MRKPIGAALMIGIATLVHCGDTNATTASADPPPPLVQDVQTPAGPGSSVPHLSMQPDGRVLMSWIEPRGSQHAVRIATFDGKKFGAPRDVVVSDRLFVNWADFPSVVPGPNGSLFAHWLEKTGEGSSYDIRIARSAVEGGSWSEASLLHDDGTRTEHGFVTLALDPAAGAMDAVWLDGRNMKEGAHDHAGNMSLRFARLQPDGKKTAEVQLDDRTCECCQTGMAISSRGPVIAYRDRSADEVRDIAVVRWTGRGWTKPIVPHPDGWKIPGCPVNGPQVAARGDRVALAWFTAANDQPKVWVSFSENGGETFARPVSVDDGKPTGRVDVSFLEDGSALVTWLERSGQGADVKVRKIRANGVRGESIVLGSTAAARASGFPRIASAKERAYIAWTEPGEPSRLRFRVLDVKGMNR